MQWNDHSKLEGLHALLSPSSYYWTKYDREKLLDYKRTHDAAEIGTRYHELAKELIELNEPLPRKHKTFNMYVNDAIGFHMESEQLLFYSLNCFGTADAICFRNDILRIHDLKTGVTATHMEQLMIYAALFCLEYNVKPTDIQIILRIYQNNEINELEPDVDDILHIMDRIITADKIISSIREQE